MRLGAEVEHGLAGEGEGLVAGVRVAGAEGGEDDAGAAELEDAGRERPQDRHGLEGVGLGLGEAAGVQLEVGEVGEGDADVEVLGAVDLLAQGEGALDEDDRAGQGALVGGEGGEVVEEQGVVGAVGLAVALEQDAGALEVALGGGEVVGVDEGVAEVVERGEEVEVVEAAALLLDGEHAAVDRQAGVVVAAVAEGGA